MKLYHTYISPLGKSFLENFNIGTLIGFIISGVLLWLMFYSSGLTLQGLRFSPAGFSYFMMAEFVFIVSIWVCAVRARMFWQKDHHTITSSNCFSSLVIGNFYNCLLPGNLGDGMRAWHFSNKNKLPFLQSLAGLFAEKWIDAQYFLFLAIGLFTIKPFVGHYVSYTILYTAIIILFLTALYLSMRYNRWVERPLLQLILLLKKTGKILFRLYFFTAWLMSDLLKRKGLVKYLLFCSLAYTLNAFQFFFLLKAAGVVAPSGGLYTSYLISLSMMIIAFIPSAPSNIGVLHYGLYSVLIFTAIQAGLKPAAADLQAYARFAVYVHISYLIPELLMGIVYIIKERKTVFQGLQVVGNNKLL